jgi:hypothetical protein
LIMAVPPDQLMKLMAGQKDKATPGGLPPPDDANTMGMSDGATPPMGAPMSTPEPKMGNREASMINISMAMDLLEQALPALGSESPEGQKVLAAIRTMIGVVGQKKGKVNELQPTEIMQMLQTLPQAGGATPEGNAMKKAPMIPGMSPGGMPPPPPPPMGGAGGPPPGGMPPPPPM